MADFYPSEIARLVLGYLKEVNCPKAWRTFLEECVDLQEHYRLLKSGRSCSTKIGRKSLLDILHEYCCLIDSRDCDSLNIQEPTAEFGELCSFTDSTQTNKDEFEQVPVIETLPSKYETDPAVIHDGTQKIKTEHNSVHETFPKLPAPFQVLPVSSESAANIEVHEWMQTDNDKSNLTWESDSKDMSTSCMSIIQPEAKTQLQRCNFEQSGIILKNANGVYSEASNINESSTLVSASEMENMSRFDDAGTLKPVSIRALLQIGTQIAESQAICSVNEPIPATQTNVCYPFSSLIKSTQSFNPSNINVSVLPAVQNQPKLSTGFSPHGETSISNISDQIKSNEIDHSFSFYSKAVEKYQEEISPVHPSTLLNKAKLKTSLKESTNSPIIPAGIKILSKWNHSKMNNNSITRSEDEISSKSPRRSKPNTKFVGFMSLPKTKSPLKRKTEHSSGHSRTHTYRIKYSDRQAHRLQLKNRK